MAKQTQAVKTAAMAVSPSSFKVKPHVLATSGNTFTVSFDGQSLGQSARTFYADAAFVRSRYGYVEMVFVQLHPLDSKKAERVALIKLPRLDPTQFQSFQRLLAETLPSEGRANGEFVTLAHEADGSNATGAVLIAETCLVSHTGFVGYIAFVSLSGQGVRQNPKDGFVSELECALPAVALADLVDQCCDSERWFS